jgi:hypothetical protein
VNSKTATTDNRFIQYLVNRLPSHLKRIIFLASITAAAKNVSETDEEFIDKLNSLMQLSNTGNNALKLPIYINRLIWKHREYIQKDLDTLVCPTSDDQSKQACVDRIDQLTPTWLKYADRETIVGDLNKLFRCNNLFSRAA